MKKVTNYSSMNYVKYPIFGVSILFTSTVPHNFWGTKYTDV